MLFVSGGKERKDSSLNALKKIKKYKPQNVLIHDAARPNFSIKLLKNLVTKLKKNIAVIPVIKSRDSIKYENQSNYINLEFSYLHLSEIKLVLRSE